VVPGFGVLAAGCFACESFAKLGKARPDGGARMRASDEQYESHCKSRPCMLKAMPLAQIVLRATLPL